jgi:hypothetical protein
MGDRLCRFLTTTQSHCPLPSVPWKSLQRAVAACGHLGVVSFSIQEALHLSIIAES